jgi:hypothetical protein
MDCISCGISTVKYTESSYLELPTFQYKKCGLYVTGESKSEIIEKTTGIYQKNIGGKIIYGMPKKELKQIVKTRFF